MRPLAHFLALLASCITIIVTGCDGSIQAQKDEPPAKKEDTVFLKAFSDFEFVGSGSVSDDVQVPSHGLSSKVFPSVLEANVPYVFHHRRLNNDEERLFEVIQNRLKTNGVTILEAKVGPYTFIGGAEFLISFMEGDTKGTIFTSLDRQIVNTPDLYEQWDPSDYVVILKAVGESKAQR